MPTNAFGHLPFKKLTHYSVERDVPQALRAIFWTSGLLETRNVKAGTILDPPDQFEREGCGGRLSGNAVAHHRGRGGFDSRAITSGASAGGKVP
jgi:hypothetical protein